MVEGGRTANTVVPMRPPRAARMPSEQEKWRENVRQTSALIAEQFLGWGSLLSGVAALIFPHLSPLLLTTTPTTFIVIGAGILSGKKLAAILKAALGAL
jgi:hypothetical protein